MMERIRYRIWRLRQSICTRQRKKLEYAPIKGNIQNVIIVKPENRMFSHAVFVLSDDYVRQSRLPTQELLRQASEAAGEYGGLMPPRAGAGRWLKALLAIIASLMFLFGAYYFIFM